MSALVSAPLGLLRIPVPAERHGLIVKKGPHGCVGRLPGAGMYRDTVAWETVKTSFKKLAMDPWSVPEKVSRGLSMRLYGEPRWRSWDAHFASDHVIDSPNR
jgi:hypothetical protein